MGMTRLFCVIFLCSRIFAYDNQVRSNYTGSSNISDWTRNFRRDTKMEVNHVDDPSEKLIPWNYEESHTIDPAYSAEGRSSGIYHNNWNPRNNTLKKWLLSLVRVETDTLENFMRIYRVQIFYDLMFSLVKWSFYAYWAWFLP